MKKLLILCITCAFFSCKSSDKKAGDGNESILRATYRIEPIRIQDPVAPEGIRLNGKIMEAWSWVDSLGKNLLYLNEVAPYERTGSDEEDARTAELFASHFIHDSTGYREVWTGHAAEKDCPLDITCRFLPGSTTITDLDSNGIAEFKIQYEQTCRGDVSPANMKLVIVENGHRYSLQGARWVQTGPEDAFLVTEENVNLEKQPKSKDEFVQMMYGFGRYESEKEFAGAPPAFLFYARKEWMKYAREITNVE